MCNEEESDSEFLSFCAFLSPEKAVFCNAALPRVCVFDSIKVDVLEAQTNLEKTRYDCSKAAQLFGLKLPSSMQEKSKRVAEEILKCSL